VCLDDWESSVDVVLVWVRICDEGRVDVLLSDIAALFCPVRKLASFNIRGADWVLACQGGSLASVPLPVAVAQRGLRLARIRVDSRVPQSM